MKKINKDEFTKMVHRKVNGEMQQRVNYWSVYWTIRAMLLCLEDIIEEGNTLYLREHFTMFPRVRRKKRTGNFGNPCVIPEHYKLCFKTHKRLNDACERMQENSRMEAEDENIRD